MDFFRTRIARITRMKAHRQGYVTQISLIPQMFFEHGNGLFPTAAGRYHPQQYSHLDERFSHLDERFSHLDERFSHLDERFSHLVESFSHLVERFSHLVERFSHLAESFSPRARVRALRVLKNTATFTTPPHGAGLLCVTRGRYVVVVADFRVFNIILTLFRHKNGKIHGQFVGNSSTSEALKRLRVCSKSNM